MNQKELNKLQEIKERWNGRGYDLTKEDYELFNHFQWLISEVERLQAENEKAVEKAKFEYVCAEDYFQKLNQSQQKVERLEKNKEKLKEKIKEKIKIVSLEESCLLQFVLNTMEETEGKE